MHWKPDNKLTLIVIVLVLLFAGFLLTMLSNYYVSRKAIRERIVNTELPITVDLVHSEIQKELIRPVLVSQMMADDTFLRDWALGTERDSAKIIKYLKMIKDRFHAVTSFFVSEQSRIYYYAGGILKQIKESEWRDVWYFRVRKMEKPYEINVDIDMANHDAMTIFINYRVYDYQSRFIGATGIGLTVDSVKKLLDSYQTQYNQRIFFLNHEGLVILSGEKNGWNQRDIRKVKGLSEMADRILGTKNGYLSYQVNGDTKFIHVRYIPEFDWHLCIEKSEKEAIQAIKRVFYLNIAIFVTISTVFLIIVGLVINLFQSRLEKMAITDKLTGLYNRQAFDVLIEKLFLRSKRTPGTTFAVVIMDIDNFKGVNDVFGHLIGDQVLQAVARIANERLRASDILCRWGGEEFLIALPDCTASNALKITENIRVAVSEHNMQSKDGLIKMTISAGLGGMAPGETLDQLLNRVDMALYKAKTSGKNRTVVADLPDERSVGKISSGE